MSKHTEGPWTYRNGSRIYLDGIEVAQISFTAGHLKESREQARFIAAACNCHDELLAACKAAAIFIRNGVDLGFIRMPDEEVPDPAHLVPEMLEAAIAKAEGGKKADHD